MGSNAKPAAPSKRVTVIQTPGAVADDSTAATGADDASQEKATIAQAPQAKAKEPQVRPSRAQYRTMDASEIDATTLTTAVLTKQGWLCPEKIPAAK